MPSLAYGDAGMLAAIRGMEAAFMHEPSHANLPPFTHALQPSQMREIRPSKRTYQVAIFHRQ